MSKLSTGLSLVLPVLLLASGVHCSSEGPTEVTLDPGTNPSVGGASGSGGETGGSGGTAATGGMGGSGGGAAGVGAEGGTGGSGAQDAGSDVADTGTTDTNFQYDVPVTDTSLNPDSACAASRVEVTQTPLDMYIMLDRSGSMVEPGYSWSALPTGGITITGGDCNYNPSVSPLNSRWCYSLYALAGYFKSAESNGNRAALQVYPTTGYNCSSPTNNSLTTPLVGYQTLNGGAQTLINALNAADPLGSNTPTKAALHGLAGFTAANQTSGRITIAILITDGIPNSCAPDDGPTLGSIAAAHLAATGIRTYVIGMTGLTAEGFNVLEAIAAAGGAPSHTQYCSSGVNPCHFYNVGQGDSQVFIDVLEAIQKNAIGCTYSLPTTDAGIVDPNQIEVQYTPGGTGTPVDLERVNSAAACAGNSWYYDGSSPPNIVLCPSTCSQVEADPQARVDILVGCEGS
jgi:hypothetical protein